MTGLVVGSLTPDFEYFLRMRIAGHFSHTLPGIWIFDLPIGVLLAFVFHNIVRDNLIDNLPPPLASRFSVFTTFNWNKHFKTAWPVVVVSIVIGAASHIFWDGFTHRDGYFVQKIPALAGVVDLLSTEVEIFRVLQHLSTLVGFIVIGVAIFQLPVSRGINSNIPSKYWGTITAIALAVLVIRLATGLNYRSPGDFVVNILSAGMIGLILTPLILRGQMR